MATEGGPLVYRSQSAEPALAITHSIAWQVLDSAKTKIILSDTTHDHTFHFSSSGCAGPMAYRYRLVGYSDWQ